MTINDIVDNAYCINLDRRSDRWASVKKQFEDNNLIVKRFPAFDGNSIDDFPLMSRGKAGCLKSHLEVLKKAQSDELSCVAIFEDDAFFVPDFEKKFDAFYPQVPEDWQLLYLATNRLGGRYEKVSENIFKVKDTYMAHALLIKSTAINTAIDIMNGGAMEADVCYALVQNIFPSYCFTPILAGQVAGFSDIENCDVDYNHVYEM